MVRVRTCAHTGLPQTTLLVGAGELEHSRAHPETEVSLRIYGLGAMREPLTDIDPGLEATLDALVDPATRGHLESPLGFAQKTEMLQAGDRFTGFARWPCGIPPPACRPISGR